MELTIDSKRKQIHIQFSSSCCCYYQSQLNIFRNVFSTSLQIRSWGWEGHVSVTNRPHLMIALFSDRANIQSYNGTVKAILTGTGIQNHANLPACICLQAFHNQQVLMTIKASRGHMFTICMFHSWLPTNRINGKAISKTTSGGHVVSRLTTAGDSFNNPSRTDTINTARSCDVLLNNCVAGFQLCSLCEDYLYWYNRWCPPSSGWMMDYSDMAISQEEGNIFQKEKGDDRQHGPQLERRQMKRATIATPQKLPGYIHYIHYIHYILGVVRVQCGKILSAMGKCQG